jgi:glycosyltransferase involved in cell wall biosynthesis
MARYFKTWHKVAFYFKMWNDTSYRYSELKKNVDHFVYNSGYTQFRIDLSPGSVIYNPVNVEPKLERATQSGNILFIGNVTERKGVKVLAEAVSDLDVTLNIVGDGYLLSKIDGGNIVKYGKLDYEKTKELLSQSEMLLVPSLWPEPFGRVAVEGMAAGVPTIVSPYGGLPEVVGEGAWVLKEVSVPELRESINRIRSDNTLRNMLVERGRERSKKFRSETIGKEIISFYEGLLQNR